MTVVVQDTDDALIADDRDSSFEGEFLAFRQPKLGPEMRVCVERPGGLADGVAFDLDELRPELLGQLVALYVDRFPDLGVARVIELLIPGSS